MELKPGQVSWQTLCDLVRSIIAAQEADNLVANGPDPGEVSQPVL